MYLLRGQFLPIVEGQGRSLGVARMLRKIAEQITVCLGHAAEARECAKVATDPGIKVIYTDIEQQWTKLAESCRFVEQADRFLSDARNQR